MAVSVAEHRLDVPVPLLTAVPAVLDGPLLGVFDPESWGTSLTCAHRRPRNHAASTVSQLSLGSLSETPF